MRHNHHETMNLAGIIIVSAPWLAVGAQVAVNTLRRRKKKGRK